MGADSCIYMPSSLRPPIPCQKISAPIRTIRNTVLWKYCHQKVVILLVWLDYYGNRPLTASNLVAAERDGEYGLTVPLRIDKVERTPDHDWWAQLVHCSDVLGTHVKLTVFDDDDCDLVDYSFEEGTWYEFDDVNLTCTREPSVSKRSGIGRSTSSWPPRDVAFRHD